MHEEYKRQLHDFKTNVALGNWEAARQNLRVAVENRPCDEVLPTLKAMLAEVEQRRAISHPSGIWKFLSALGFNRVVKSHE